MVCHGDVTLTDHTSHAMDNKQVNAVTRVHGFARGCAQDIYGYAEETVNSSMVRVPARFSYCISPYVFPHINTVSDKRGVYP